LATGWWLGSRSPVAPASAVPAVDAEKEGLREEIARLESELETANAKLERERDRANLARKMASRAPPGADKPLPFPPGAPEGFRPSAFKVVAAHAAEQCGMNLELVEVECTEYPCIAFMRMKAGARPRQYSMQDCAPWKDALGTELTVQGVPGADGDIRGFAWMPLPPSEADQPVARYRAGIRIDKRRGEMAPW
jgi:hypothetical protein